jgi:hypothetical protein
MKDSKRKRKNEVSTQELFFQTDKLSVIHRNIEKFLDKLFKEKRMGLETPQQFKKYENFLNILQWIVRFAAAGGGVLALTGRPIAGGIIGIFCPLFGALISYFKEKSEGKKRKWDEFVKDCENLRENLDRLIIMIDSVKNFSSEKISEAMENLNDKIYGLLKEYDRNKDRKISVSELKIEKLAEDLRKSWRKKINNENKKEKGLREIMSAIQNLQSEMVEDYSLSSE